MSKTHADIEAHLDFSEKYRKQIEAHQHETAQLLTDMEQLQGEVHNLLDENEQLYAECDAKDARIAELESRIAQLEARPYIYADQAAFFAQKDQLGGYKTMRSYLWKLEGDLYDAQHNG